MNDTVYEVQSIFGWKHQNGQELYALKWLGYDYSQSTWEPVTNLINCGQLLLTFHQQLQNVGPTHVLYDVQSLQLFIVPDDVELFPYLPAYVMAHDANVSDESDNDSLPSAAGTDNDAGSEYIPDGSEQDSGED